VLANSNTFGVMKGKPCQTECIYEILFLKEVLLFETSASPDINPLFYKGKIFFLGKNIFGN